MEGLGINEDRNKRLQGERKSTYDIIIYLFFFFTIQCLFLVATEGEETIRVFVGGV